MLLYCFLILALLYWCWCVHGDKESYKKAYIDKNQKYYELTEACRAINLTTKAVRIGEGCLDPDCPGAQGDPFQEISKKYQAIPYTVVDKINKTIRDHAHSWYESDNQSRQT